jgi:hypothetical protein
VIDNDRNVPHFLLLSCFCHFDLFTLKNSDLGHNKRYAAGESESDKKMLPEISIPRLVRLESSPSARTPNFHTRD